MPISRKRHRRPTGESQTVNGLPWLRLLFVASVLSLAVGLYFAFGASSAASLPVRRWTAATTVWLLNLMGAQASVSDTLITASALRFVVVNDCTPVGVILLVWGAVIASPAPVKPKLLGIPLVALALTTLNLARMVSLIYVGTSFPGSLDTVHLLVWQPLMILAAVLMWVVWYASTPRTVHR